MKYIRMGRSASAEILRIHNVICRLLRFWTCNSYLHFKQVHLSLGHGKYRPIMKRPKRGCFIGGPKSYRDANVYDFRSASTLQNFRMCGPRSWFRRVCGRRFAGEVRRALSVSNVDIWAASNVPAPFVSDQINIRRRLFHFPDIAFQRSSLPLLENLLPGRETRQVPH